MGDLGSTPRLGRFPWRGKGYPLQYPGLENSMDCIAHGVAESQTRLSNFHFRASLRAQLVKNLPAMQETPVGFLGQEDPLEKGTAAHSSTLAWRIPWLCTKSDTTEWLPLTKSFCLNGKAYLKDNDRLSAILTEYFLCIVLCLSTWMKSQES